MELRADQAHRQVELRGEQQHGEPDREGEVPVGELDADRGGHERRAEHRQQLQDECREERDPQRRHRLLAVAVTGGAQRLRPCAVAIVRAQRLEPADDVEEVRAQQRERLPALLRAPARREPDQDHEHGDQRHRDEQDQPRGEVRGITYARISTGTITASTTCGT